MRKFALEVAASSGLGARLHPEVIPVVRWAERQGIGRYVVSASHAIVVESCIELLRLPIDGVFAMSQAEEDGFLVARLREPVTYGAGKTEALRGGITGKMLLGAFGDSAFDLAPALGRSAAGRGSPQAGLASSRRGMRGSRRARSGRTMSRLG